MIAAVVLAKWDNVMGPKTLKVWGPKDDISSSYQSGLKFSWAGETGKTSDVDELDEAWEATSFEFDREESPEIICTSDKSSSSSIVVLSGAASEQTNQSDSICGDGTADEVESSQYTVLENDLSERILTLELPEEEGRMKVFLCDSVKYVTEHTVIACLSKPSIEELELIKNSYFVVPDFYSIMVCVTFYVDEYVTDCGTLETSYSLSVIGDIEDENMFLLLKNYMEFNLREMAKFIKSLPEIDCLVDDFRLDSKVSRLLNHVHSLLKQNFTSLVKAELVRGLLVQADLDSILTAHLQTFGNTYVCGNKYPLVDQIVGFLSHFLWDESQKQLCRIVSEFEAECYCPGLYVQGYVFSRTRKKPGVKEILLNPYPLTLVDVSVTPIFTIQSSSYVDHMQRRKKSANSQPKKLSTNTNFKNVKSKESTKPAKSISLISFRKTCLQWNFSMGRNY